jgi:hypothetical protein
MSVAKKEALVGAQTHSPGRVPRLAAWNLQRKGIGSAS